MKKNDYGRCIFMKLIMFLLLGLALDGYPSSLGQNKIKINFREISYGKLFEEIRAQTGVIIMYNNDVLDESCKIQADFGEVDLNDLLDKVLLQKGFTYRMEDGFVIVSKTRQQNKEYVWVRGKVKDVNGTPLPGVTVRLKEAMVGTSTSVEGKYEINIPKEGAVLVFSFIGMETVEVKYVGKDTIDVVMVESAEELEEVTVVETGYTALPRKDMVGAFTTVKAENIMMPAYNSIDQMLQGKVPGMVVVNSSARVGRGPQITIRGKSTILGNTDPLWVVDGIIQSDPLDINMSQMLTEDMANLIGNQISWLNPMDIEDITVLKDASATAIYGSKASNGVIVITTKKGVANRMSVRYSMNFTFRVRPNYGMFNFMNSKERIQFSKEAYDAGVRYEKDPLPQIYTYEGLMAMYNKKQISEADLMKQMEFLETNNTDWLKILTRNSLSQSHNLSISGGSEKITYSSSFGYSANRGTEIGNDMNQFTARLNLGAQLHKAVRLEVNMNGTISENKGYGPNVSPEDYARNTSRAIPLYDQDGKRVFYKQFYEYKYNKADKALHYGYNVLNEMENSYSKNKSSRLGASINLNWDITSWLKYQLVGGVSNNINKTEAFAGEKSSYITTRYRGYDYGTEKSGSEKFAAAMLPFGGELQMREGYNLSLNMQHKVLFSKTVNEIHRFNAMAAMELRSEEYKNTHNTVWGYVPERGEILVSPTYPTEIKVIGGDEVIAWGALDRIYQGGWGTTSTTNNFVSFFATFAYSLKDRYVLNANVRSDASNRFGQDQNKRFDPTYSFGISWRMAEEKFVKNISWINQFNLRASFGVQGNVVTSISPELIAHYEGILEGYNEYWLSISSLPNPLLKWERTKTWNFGVDIQLLKGISLNFEYYGRRSNAIVDREVANEYGVRKMRLNGGRISNQGIEVSLNLTPYRTENFAWTVGINSSKNWNKSKSDDAEIKAQREDAINRNDFLAGNSGRLLKKGYPIDGFWSYSFAGLNPENGYPMFNKLDIERNPQIDPTQFLVYSGQTNPYFTGGLNTRIRYKNISVGADFSVLLGSKKRLDNPYSKFSNGRLPEPYYNLSKNLLKRWQKPGDKTIYPALYTSVEDLYTLDLPDGGITNVYDAWGLSDAMVVNASFLRCTQISVSYQLPKHLLQKIRVTQASVSANVNNPFVIGSKRFDGFDPELGDSVMPKMFSFGLSVGF